SLSWRFARGKEPQVQWSQQRQTILIRRDRTPGYGRPICIHCRPLASDFSADGSSVSEGCHGRICCLACHLSRTVGHLCALCLENRHQRILLARFLSKPPGSLLSGSVQHPSPPESV